MENSYTPSSSVTITVVRGPYSATRLINWSRPVAPIRPSLPEPDDEPQTPTMVPTAQLLSTIDEPSSGSQHTVYSPSGLHARTSGSSSDAPNAMTADSLHLFHMISSAITSTESCWSPKVLDEPSTVTSAERSASVMSAHASSISTMHVRSFSSLHLAASTTSRLS